MRRLSCLIVSCALSFPLLAHDPGGNSAKGQVDAAFGFPDTFNYDGVTAGLKVNADLNDPLLCVSSVWDVDSGDLSLPATWNAKDKP